MSISLMQVERDDTANFVSLLVYTFGDLATPSYRPAISDQMSRLGRVLVGAILHFVP
jgi:hypothetical protein